MRFVAAMSALCLAAALLLSGCGGSKGEPAASPSPMETGVLRVGLEPEFEPMEYRTPDGRIVGFDVDLIGAIAAELGLKVELVSTAWDGIIPALIARKIEVICSGMTITEERKQSVAFSDFYFETGLCLLVNLEQGEAIKTWADLNREGVILAVKRGTTGELTAEKLMPLATRNVYDTENDCAHEVANGRALAFVYDQLSILKHARQHQKTTRAILEPFNTEQYGIAMRKDSTELLALINKALAAIRADGRYQAIYDKYVSLAGDAPR